MSNDILLTKEGYDKIVEELDNLVTVRRKEVAERIKEAISYGDISENSEYDSAKNEQAELEDRINKLENMIRKAKIIDDSEISRDRVSVGLKVKIREKGSGEETEYSIVGSTEADPFEGKISNESTLGAALLGKKNGDEVEIQVPDGIFFYEIIDIYK
jgi:transcription elongation factor GreA